MATLVAVVAGLAAVQGRAGRALAMSPTDIRHSDAAVRKICSNPSLNQTYLRKAGQLQI